MMQVIKTFLVTFVVFMLIDLVWLGFIARKLYTKYLGYIMKKDVNWPVAIAFYIIFIIGLLFFVLYPAMGKDSWTYALLVGMLYGFVTYSTYDLTNLSTLKDWPVQITIIDLIWGSTLSGLTSVISYFILNR